MFEWLNCRWRCLCQKNVSCINQKYISYRYHRNPFPPEMRSKKKNLGLILPFKAWWIVFVPTEFEKNRGLRVMVEDGFMLNSVSFENGGTPFPIVLYGVDSQAEHKSQGFSHYFPSYDNRIDPSHWTISIVRHQILWTSELVALAAAVVAVVAVAVVQHRSGCTMECNIGFAGEHLFFVKNPFYHILAVCHACVILLEFRCV